MDFGMNRKIKFALAALLGFSAACSSVKHTPAKGSGEGEVPETGMQVDTVHPVVVMYGVPAPRPRQYDAAVDSPAGLPSDSAGAVSNGRRQ